MAAVSSPPPATDTVDAHASRVGRRPLRRDIQGLRAIAVALVVVYHVWPDLLPGGYVGVDVFFVISGFLITGHLLEGSRLTRRALLRFWARRVRRLLPAALLVMLATLVAVVVFLPDLRWAQTARETLAATFYVENWQLAKDAVDYLQAGTPRSVVQHYWSLSVEEQFYAVWPVLLMAAATVAARRGRSRVGVSLVVVLVVTVLSFAASVWYTLHSPSLAYFATQGRMWEFGVGAVLAGLVVHRRSPHPVVARLEGALPRAPLSLLGWLGLAAVVGAAFLYSAGTPFPGWAALLPVVGTAAVIAVPRSAARFGPERLIGTGPFQLVGNLSYSLYLWHWPVVVVLGWVTGPGLGWLAGSVAILASTALAWATKRWVEDRLLVTRPLPLRQTFRFGVVAMAVVSLASGGLLVATLTRENAAQDLLARATLTPGTCLGAASLVRGSGCVQSRTGPVVPDPLIAGQDRTRLYDDGCWENPPFAGTASCTYGDPSAPLSIALVGNSHAGHWFAAVQALAAERHARVTTFLAAGCTVTTARLTWETEERADGCLEWGRRVVEATSSDRFDLIITSEISTRSVEGGTLANRQADWKRGFLGVLQQ